MISPLIWICILFVPIWSQYTVPHSDPSLVSILFEHIILKLMCFLWNSGHFSSHFRTFLVEFCRDRRLRAFFVNSGLFSSHFRTFIVEFCRDRRLRAFPKILKILASSLFSLPCLTFFLTLLSEFATIILIVVMIVRRENPPHHHHLNSQEKWEVFTNSPRQVLYKVGGLAWGPGLTSNFIMFFLEQVSL